MKHASIILLLTLVWACGTPYLDAAGEFAKATGASATILGGMTDLAHQLCLERAHLDYLVHRLEGSNKLDAHGNIDPRRGQPVPFARYFSAAQIPVPGGEPPTQSWETHCSQVGVADQLATKALQALSAYANALQTVAVTDFTGSNVKQLGTDAGALARALTQNTSSTTNKVAAISGAVSELAGTLEKQYAEAKVKDIVTTADPDVKTILAGLISYLDAVGEEGTDATHLLRTLLADADTKLSSPDPVALLTLQNISARWQSDLQSKLQALSRMSAALSSLSDAESNLAAAAGKKAPDLGMVLADVNDVVTNIQAIQKAF